jgi:uncharacterized protein YecE (DUF72 family)
MPSSHTDRAYIGTSGWSYEDWKGVVYPDTGRGDSLMFMARHFDALEINVSFYRDVPPEMADNWLHRIARTNRFLFTAKLHQRFTHQRSAMFPRHDLAESLDGLRLLNDAGRLGAVLAQFPWSYRDGSENREWLRQLAESCPLRPLVIEVRHDSWLTDEALAFVKSLGVGWCNIDQPAHQHCIPPTELVLPPIGYVRLHGRNHARWFDHDEASQRYDYLYTEPELDAWVVRVRRIAAQAERTFVFTNNHFRGQAPANALQLMAKLRHVQVDVPDGLLCEYPVLGKHARPSRQSRQGRLFD